MQGERAQLSEERRSRDRLARWIEQHGDDLYRYALLRLRDRHAAEDAVQECLLAALRSRAPFRHRSNARTWLTGILRHKVIDDLRRRTREDGWSAAADEALWTEGDATAAAPGRRLEPADAPAFREAVWAAIMNLPEPMRQAFCLREIDGLAGPKICKVLGITPTNLWTLLHRARMRLRRDLDEAWGDHQ